MTLTESKNPTVAELQARFSAVVKMVKDHPDNDDLQKRLGAHFRAISDGKLINIAMYHIAASVSMADKWETYNKLASVIAAGDWSQLDGNLGAGARKIESDEKPATPVAPRPGLHQTCPGTVRLPMHPHRQDGGRGGRAGQSTYLSRQYRLRNLGGYHANVDVGAEAKAEEYKRIAGALGITTENGRPVFKAPDWSLLKGQTEASEADAKPEPKRADPMAEPKAVRSGNLSQISRPQPPGQADGEDLATVIARAIQGRMQLPTTETQVDEGRVKLIVNEILDSKLHDEIKKANHNGAFPSDRVQKLIAEAMAQIGVHRIELVQPNGELKTISGLMHPQVPQAAAWLNAGVPLWAWSAAGSGKTHSARQIAEVLDVVPYVVSVDPTLTVAKLLGYRNVANGNFVEGYLYKAYKHGGLVALDEIDTGDPGVVASINALLSSTHYLFPNNETVERHAQFHIMALANTKGTGAVAGYTARNKLDAATLDRFAIIEWKYDEGMETALACGLGSPDVPWKGGPPASEILQRRYVEWVQKVRKQVGNSVLLSPRASINGCRALRAGIPLTEVIEALVFKLVNDDTRKRITDTCELPSELQPAT